MGLYTKVYRTHFKNWHFGCAKTSGFDDRIPPHISNIGQDAIVEPREVSRRPKSHFSSAFGILCLALFLFLGGCKRYYLMVSQEIVNRDSLASTHVGTPDPRQANPPEGRELCLSWQIPCEIFQQRPRLELDVIYWNYTEGHFFYSMDAKRGYVLYTLAGKEYEEKEGLLSYRARIVTQEGVVYRKWTQQLFVELIRVGDRDYTPPLQPALPEMIGK